VSVGSEYRDDTARQPLPAHPNKKFRTAQADHPPWARVCTLPHIPGGRFRPTDL